MSQELPTSPPDELESQLFPDGEQLFKAITNRDPGFWDAYAVAGEDSVVGQGLSGHIKRRTITGTTESGASIEIKESDSEIYYEPPQPGTPSGSGPKELDVYKKGISITVTPPDKPGGPARVIELFVPDDPAAHPGVEPPQAISYFEAGLGEPFKTVPAVNPAPEDAGKYETGIAEIKYYLGDRVLWESPQSAEIIPAPSAAPDNL